MEGGGGGGTAGGGGRVEEIDKAAVAESSMESECANPPVVVEFLCGKVREYKWLRWAAFGLLGLETGMDFRPRVCAMVLVLTPRTSMHC